MYFRVVSSCLVVAFLFGATLTQSIAQQVVEPDGVDAALHKSTVDRGVVYLLEKGQNLEDGSYSKQLSTAVTALCTTALIRNGVPVSNAKVQKSLEYILKHVREDGGIYSDESTLKNYETSLGLMCLVEANTDGRYDEKIRKASEFLTGIQWDGAEGHALDSAFYGGWGYGKHKRPDMSNAGFAMDALMAAGIDPNSSTMQKALTFSSRTQNLSSKHNTMEYAAKASEADRGGFIYSPANGGETKAGETDAGGLRSYASMTYVGLKSFLYAGLTKDDARVQAALDWIQRNYGLDSNPGMQAQGLYYYYHVFAKALHVFGDRTVTDAEGQIHNWRAELVQELAKRQLNDGAWVNETDRWFEGDKNLVTAYSLLALSYCKPELDK